MRGGTPVRRRTRAPPHFPPADRETLTYIRHAGPTGHMRVLRCQCSYSGLKAAYQPWQLTRTPSPGGRLVV